jgi:uncharacterized protein (TIGR02996 family)
VRALERQIAAAPDDPAPYLVLADHLLSRGVPHGELITLHDARRRRPGDAALAKRDEAWRRQHATELFGELAPYALQRARKGRDPALELDWFMGHLRGVQISMGQGDRVADLLPALLARPVMRFVRHLGIGYPGGTSGDFVEVVAALGRLELPPTLRSLVLGDAVYDFQARFTTVGSLAPVLARCRRLTSLRVFGTDIDLTDLPSGLRELAIDTDAADAAPLLRSIATARKLERLSIAFGASSEDVAVAELRPVLGLPRLVSLHLRLGPHADELVPVLARTRLARRLVHLGLQFCYLHDEHLEMLRGKLPALRTFDISDNYVTAKRMVGFGAVTLGEQDDPAEDYTRHDT